MDAVFELAERITVLHEGRVLAEGTPDEIQANGFVQEAYLGGVARAHEPARSQAHSTAITATRTSCSMCRCASRSNEVVALLGRNGAGKSTTLKSLMGVVTPRSGSIRFDGDETRRPAGHAIAQAGMQLVPEERRIFGSLNVEENIVLAGLTAPNRWPLERIYEIFPRLQGAARAAAAPISRAASSRCWRSPARWCAIRRSSCSTSRSRGWRR